MGVLVVTPLTHDLKEAAAFESILRLPEVKSRTGLPRSTIYLRISQGTFPSPISLGARSVGWIASEVEKWIADRITQSRQTDQGKQVIRGQRVSSAMQP